MNGHVRARDNPGLTNYTIKIPAVVGAIIDPGYCLNLIERNSLLILKDAYEILKGHMDNSNKEMPINKNIKGRTVEKKS